LQAAERWAVMEWIVYNRRLAAITIAVVALAILSVLGALWGLGIGHLSPVEKANYLQREEEREMPRGPLIREIHRHPPPP
jgi:hypothetical protein